VPDERDLSASPNKDYDSIRVTYKCETKGMAARFQFTQGRSDYRLWCDYRVGTTLAEIPAFKPEDFTYVPDDPPPLVKLLASIFG
jgi:hypothetical protein